MGVPPLGPKADLGARRLTRELGESPAFDLDLCELFGVLPLEFDGRSDSTLHPFDRAGKLHMEYVVDRGSFADLPLEELTRVSHQHYPHLFDEQGRLVDWARDARAARARRAAG